VLKPFQGAENDGPGDAAVLRPVPGFQAGIAVACGIAPKYSDLDAYHMMACAIDEAVRNLVAVGAKMGTIAGLDNFCWPDPVRARRRPTAPTRWPSSCAAARP
jgi:phosphoribosylformylglycinamidine (FGAM) synthase-like enzyme